MKSTDDIVDVEFETVKGETSAKTEAKPTAKQIREELGEEQLSVFGKRSFENKQKRMSLPVFTLVASICAVSAFYFAGGHTLLTPKQNVIPTISVQQPLQFSDIASEVQARSGKQFLKVTATIINNDKVARTLPPVIITLGDDPQTRRLFRIERGETLNPSERLIFTSTVPADDAAALPLNLSFSE